MSGRLESDPLFLGLTRPTLVLGVTYAWVMLEGMAGMLYFLMRSDFLGLIAILAVSHAIGFFICAKEPQMLAVLTVKLQKCLKCRTTQYHGGLQSYDVY